MDIEKSRQALEVFKEMLDAEPADTAEFVKRACGDDADLLGQVQSLVRAHGEGGAFLDRAMPVPAVAPMSMLGNRIGHFEIVKELASGGMGTVYLARQDDPQRLVALKMMRFGPSSPELLQRFRHESRVLASLQHPNIAQVYDAGVLEAGQDTKVQLPWFAMEYVQDAEPITQFARHHQLSTANRLRLFLPVCEAVGHGHQRGIIHRDLKPGNILVDQEGRPRVIDFGVARATDGDVALTMVQTDVGQLVGTLQYMSPEQCRADPTDLDARSDIYSMGIVLYELLCDCLPYDVGSRPVFEAARVILEEAPTPPSIHNRLLRGDIGTIVMTALQKDRERRYQSAADLQRDIERYLQHKPIEARPPTFWYRTKMLMRRHWAITVATVTTAFALVATTLVSLIFAVRASEARNEANRDRAAKSRQAYIASLAAAESGRANNEFRAMPRHLSRAPVEHRGWEWELLSNTAEPSLALIPQTDIVATIAAGRGGLVACGTRDGRLRVWEGERPDHIQEVYAHEGGVQSIAFDEKRKRIMTAGRDCRIRFWDPQTLEPQGELAPGSGVFSLALFTSNYDEICSIDAEQESTVARWDATTHERLQSATVPGAAIWCMAVSHDATLIATGQVDGTVVVWDAATLEKKHELKRSGLRVHDVVFMPDGLRLCSSHTGHIQVWDLIQGKWLNTLKQQGRALAMATADDPSKLIAGWGSVIRAWDLNSGREVRTLVGHDAEIYELAVDPDRGQLLSAGADSVVRVWDISPVHNLDEYAGHAGQVFDIAFSADGALLGTVAPDRSLRIWDSRAHRQLAEIPLDEWAWGIAFSPEETTLAHGARDGVRLLDVATGLELDRVAGPLVHTVSFGPQGRYLAYAGTDQVIYVYDVLKQQMRWQFSGHAGRVTDVAFDPLGSTLASVSFDQTVRLWNMDTGEPIAEVRGHDAHATALAFGPKGKLLATGGRDEVVRIWDVETAALKQELPRHGGSVVDLEFHPDGSRLASSAWFGGVAIWDTRDWELVLDLHVERDRTPGEIAFDASGDRLVVGCVEGAIELWDRRSAQARREERQVAIDELADGLERVERLLAGDGDASRVAGILRDDEAINETERSAAFRALLQTAFGKN